MPDLQKIDELLPAIPGCIFTETSLVISTELPIDVFLDLGVRLGRADRALNWLLADWWNFADHYGEDAGHVLEATGMQFEHMSRLGRVARNIPPSRRIAGLSFSHHEEVSKAGLDAADQKHYLKVAKRDSLTRQELRQLIKNEAAIDDEPEGESPPTGETNGAGAGETPQENGEVDEPDEPVVMTPEELMAELNGEIESWARSMTGLAKQGPESAWIDKPRLAAIASQLKAAAATARTAKGAGLCPECDGDGCDVCRQSGWLPKNQLEAHQA